MGDFNFPNIEWVSHTCIPSKGREQYESAEALLNFINHNMINLPEMVTSLNSSSQTMIE